MHQGYVYFIRAPINGFIKIGYTERYPTRRLDELLKSSPVALELAGTIRAVPEYERALHARFCLHRSHYEWFRPGEDLLDFIRQYAEPWNPSPEDEKPNRMPKPHTKALWRSARVIREGIEVEETRKKAEEMLAWARRTDLMWLGETHTIEEWSKIKDIPLEALRQWADEGLRYDLFYYFEKQGEREREGANLQPAD